MRTVRRGWNLGMPSLSLSLVLLTSGMGGTFVRPETRDRREKGWEENVFEMGLKDGEHSRWSE